MVNLKLANGSRSSFNCGEMKELNEIDIRQIAARIEQEYMHLSDSDWYKIVQILAKRADV